MKRRESGKRLASRLTGISGPGFGVSWTPATPDADVARRVITFLENRRALFVPYAVEDERYVMESVVEIRQFLTDLIGAGGISDFLSNSLRAMRAACLEFMTTATPAKTKRGRLRLLERRRARFMAFGDFHFNQALGKLRGLVGVQVALVASQYGLDVEGQLTTAMPPPAD